VNACCVRAVGIKSHAEYPRLAWAEDGEAGAVDRILRSHGVAEGDRFAVVQLSCNWGCNEWPSDRWAAVADSLVERYGLQVVAVGSSESVEVEKAIEVAARMRHRLVSLVGATSVRGFLALVGRASLVVATDSAITQVALAQRVPAVILFGMESREANGPIAGQGEDYVLMLQHWDGHTRQQESNPRCRYRAGSCHSADCRPNPSIDSISPDEVLRGVDRVLGRAP